MKIKLAGRRADDFFSKSKHGKAIAKKLNGKWNADIVENYLDDLDKRYNMAQVDRIYDNISIALGLNVKKMKNLKEQYEQITDAMKPLYLVYLHDYGKTAKNKLAKRLLRIAKMLLSYNKKGYGAWIDNEGKERPVQFQDHVTPAMKALKDMGVKDVNKQNAKDKLMKEGWTRVIWQGDSLNIEYDSANVSDDGVNATKSLLRNNDWNNVVVELNDKKKHVISDDSRDAMKFVTLHHSIRPSKPTEDKKKEVQKKVEKSVDKGIKDMKDKKDTKKNESDSGSYTSGQKTKWEKYKKEHPGTQYKNIKEFFEGEEKKKKDKAPAYQLWSPKKKTAWVTREEVAEVCPECAENMRKAGISKITEEALYSRSRTAYGWKNLPKGWTKKSVKKFWATLTGDKKHKVTECIRRMTKHFGEGAGGFCAGMADMADPHGPSWRFGPRKKKESSIAMNMIFAARVYIDMSEEVKINAQIKRKAGKALQKVLKPTYFEDIPLDEMFEAVNRASDLVVIDEDGTEWSGLLVGREGEAFFRLGLHGKLVSNSGLKMTWYKMESGKYEIIGYIT